MIPAVRVNQNSELEHQKATTSSIQAYHLVVTSLLGFFLGTVFGAIVFHLFKRHRRRHHHREKQTLFEINTTTNIEVKPNDYLTCDEVIPLPPNLSDDCHTYSTLTFNTKAKDATLKRNVSIQRSESLMRTKLDQPDAFWIRLVFEPGGFWTDWVLNDTCCELGGFGKGWALIWWNLIGLCFELDGFRTGFAQQAFWTKWILNKLGFEPDEFELRLLWTRWIWDVLSWAWHRDLELDGFLM